MEWASGDSDETEMNILISPAAADEVVASWEEQGEYCFSPEDPIIVSPWFEAPSTSLVATTMAPTGITRSATLARLRKCAAIDKRFFESCLKALQDEQESWLDGVLEVQHRIADMLVMNGPEGNCEGPILTELIRNILEMFAYVERLGERLEGARERQRALTSQYRALEVELIGAGEDQEFSEQLMSEDCCHSSNRSIDAERLSLIEQVVALKEQEQDMDNEHRWDISRRGENVFNFPLPLSELLSPASNRLSNSLGSAPVQNAGSIESPVAPSHASIVFAQTQ